MEERKKKANKLDNKTLILNPTHPEKQRYERKNKNEVK